MKTATIPALRVEPEVRQAAEALLEEGETLSAFVEKALRQQIANRQDQQEFIQRGIESAAMARETGLYLSAETVLGKLETRLAQARAKRAA